MTVRRQVPVLRARGFGAALCETLLGESRRRGVLTAFLLATSASESFARQGFAPLARERAPLAVRTTREFAELCPASAVLMEREP